MPLDLSADEQLLVESVAGFCRRELAPKVRPFVERHAFPTELVRAFGKLGFMGTAYDPCYGGGGLGTRGAALVCEELAKAEPGFAAIYLCNSAPMSVIA